MFTVGVRSHYEAAHFLRSYQGACARMHGHRYEVEAVLAFDTLDAAGLTVDFVELDAALQSITRELDHQTLNELPPFLELESSAENQARYIYQELKQRLGAAAPHLRHVRVWETAHHWAQYSESPEVP